MKARGLAALVSLVACGHAGPSREAARPDAEPRATAEHPAAAASAPIAFIEDDYARALAEARATGKPLFVDAWAPWCHTCLSMRAFVFPDPLLRARAGDFVWLAIDTEKAQNAAFLRAYPMDVWPTLWVVDARREQPALKWNGSATPAELSSLLDDAKRAIAAGTGASADDAYLGGNRAVAAGDKAAAIASYRRALSIAPAEWTKRARAVEALSSLLRTTKDAAGCLALARAELPRMPPGTSAKNVAMDAVLALGELPDAERRARADEVLAAAERVASDPAQPILADDRSELYGEIVDALGALGRAEDARRVARAWSALLERAASRARTPEERAVFDAHRVEAFLALGEPARAVPVLTASERDFPADYNPPARLAAAYLAMKRYDDALAAADRALAKVYGPRVLRVLTVKADILAAKGDTAGERAAIEDALARTDGMALSGGAARARAALEARARKFR